SGTTYHHEPRHGRAHPAGVYPERESSPPHLQANLFGGLRNRKAGRPQGIGRPLRALAESGRKPFGVRAAQVLERAAAGCRGRTARLEDCSPFPSRNHAGARRRSERRPFAQGHQARSERGPVDGTRARRACRGCSQKGSGRIARRNAKLTASGFHVKLSEGEFRNEDSVTRGTLNGLAIAWTEPSFPEPAATKSARAGSAGSESAEARTASNGGAGACRRKEARRKAARAKATHLNPPHD